MNEDYLDDLYKSFDSIDPTFKNDVSIEQFKQKMQDINYAKQIYNTLSSVDETYSSDVPFDSFIEQTRITPKKKEESMVSESETSSSVLPSGDGGITGRFKKGFEEATKFPQKVQQDVSKLKKFDTTQQYDKFGVPITQFPAPAREEYLAKPVQQIETKVKFEEKKEELEKKVPEFLKPSVETIDKDFLSRTVDPVISDLNRQYKGTGFEFYVDPKDKEGIIAKAPNGKTINVSLGYTNVEWFTSRKDEAERLKFFIKENSPSIGSENIVKLQKEYEQGKQNFLTEKQIEEQNKAFNEYAESLNKEIQSFLPETDMMQKMLKQIESYPEEQRNTLEYKSLVDDYNIKLEGYNKKASELDTKIKGIKEKENNLTIAAGEYTKYKAQQGAFSGYLWRQTTDAIGNIAAGWYEFAVNRKFDILPLSLLLGKENYEFNRKIKMEVLGLDPDKVDLTPSYFDKLSDGQKRWAIYESSRLNKEIDKLIRDDYKKIQKYGKLDYKGLGELNFEGGITSDDIREYFTKTFGTFNTTKEFQERINKEGNIIQRGLGGLAGSLPAMIGNKYIRIANMYMLTTDAVAKEMQDDPDFKDISENEKEIVKIPIGIVGAALEEIGFRNAIKGKAVISEITKRVLGKIPTNATASQIRKTALSEIKEISLRGGLALLGAGLAEAETGALQQVNEFLVKDIYNAAKGKRMFDTPETVGEYLYEVGDAAATESVGGFVMGVPNAISTAFSKDGFQGLDDDTFRLFEELSKATDSKKFFVIDLKNKINEGKITKAEADKILDNYDKSVGLVQQIPDEITDVNDRKVAMDLLIERKRLEDKVQGKDPALTKPIQNQINNINEQLTKLTEDAIQKQTAGEVPVQPETGVGEEVVQGEPEPELEVTPEQIVTEEKPEEEVVPEAEIKEEEVVTEQATTQQTTTDIITEAPIEIKGGVVVTDSNGRNININGNEQVVAKLYDEAMSIDEDQRTTNQNDIIEKVQRIILQAALEKSPVEEKTPEQEADLLEELITGKKKEPVMTPQVETMTPEAEVMTPEAEVMTPEAEVMTPEAEVISEGKPEIPKIEEIEETDIEIKDTQTTPEETQKQIEEFDETKIPEQEKPKPGMVAELDINEINADPQRFQYKEVTDKEAGVTEQFKGTKAPFKKELAGVISVWIDPNDGKTYVINGHHRLDYAKRSGEKTMNVIYIDAKDASEARLKGAMQNIAEGQGTDMDAAKVFRETGMTLEQVQASGINVKGAKAMNGLSLASLADSIFNLVVQGKLSQSIGIIIGSIIQDKNVQEQFYNVIKGKNLNNGTIKVMAEDIQAAKKEKVEDRQLSMFGGVEEQAAYQQRATFIASVRLLVAKAKNILGRVARSDDFLREYGNEIDRNASETGSRESAMALAVFDKLRNTSPEIRQMIDEGVERISKGENKNKVINETAKKIIEATPGILEGVTGQPVAGRGEVKEPSTKGKQGAKGKGKKLSDAVKNLKIKGPDGLQSNLFGVPIAIWNAAMDTVAAAIDAGVAISEAIQRGADYISENYKKRWQKAQYENRVLDAIYTNAINLARENGISDDGIKRYLERKGLTTEQIDKLIKKRVPKEKKPPTAEEIVGKPKPKKVTVNEMAALKDQIRLEARAAREAKGDLNSKRKALAEAINKLVAKGTLTVRQANAIIKRVNFVNLDNPIMVDRLIEYAGNIFNDADYDTRMQEIRALQSQVKKKNHTSMEGTVKDFISINPELIPDNRILEYIQALDDMNTRTPSYVKMNDMFDEVMSYKTEPEGFNAIKTFQQLMDKLESIALNEVKSVEDYINLIRDINAFKRKASQLLSNGDITQAQYDQAIENVGKDQAAVEKKYEKELTALKQGLINEIEKLRPKTNPNFTPEENALIEKYLEIGKDKKDESYLMKLAPEELYILNDLLQNIEDGQMDYYRFSDIVSKAYSKDAIDKTTEQLDKTKFDMALDKGKQLLSEFESSFWEGLLGMGRVTSGALQKFIVSPMMRAISSYEKFLQDSYNTFSKIKNKYGMNQNNMNKLGMLTTYLQEYMAQFDPSYKGTKDIGKRDWFKEILNDKDMKKQYPSEKLTMRRLFGKVVGRGKTQLESMKEIWDSLPKDKDGNVDPKAVYDSYMANDGKYFSKKEKAFFDEIMDWKQKNTTTKQKAANELKGNPFKEIPFHLLRSRYGEGAKQIAPKASGANGMVRIEAGTGKERKDQKVGPININFEQLFINGVEQTARDYYLSTAIQDVNNVMSGVASNLGKGKKTLVETITGTLSEALNYEFDKTESFAIFKRLLAARASMVLFDPERTARELIAGLLSYPIRAKTLSGYKDLFRGVKRMKELLDFTESPIRLRENISSALDISDGQIKKMNPLQKATLYLAGFPERTMMVTSWMPNFRSEFKNLTGNDFDMEAFRTDKTYKQEYGKAIREAAAVADAQTEKIIGTTTKAGQRREIRIAPEFLANLAGKRGTVSKNTVFGQVFGFFTNYPYREVTEFFNGFKEAAEVIRNNGISSTPQAAAQLSKPLGIALNVALYGYLASVSYAYWLMLLGDDDDEERGKQQLEELSTTKGIVEDFQGNAISLLASRYGVGSKALFQVGGTIAYGMSEDEERKKWIKKFMKGSMYVDPLPVEKATEYKGKEAVLASMSSYVPQLVVAADRYIDIIEGAGDVSKLYEKINEKGIDALTEDEKGQVLAISALFKTSQLGLNLFGNSLPMYNKMKIYMKKLRTESGVTEKTKSSEKREAYGGFKTIEELEIADPKKYKELSKKGGALYEFRQKEKAQRKVSEEKKAKEYEEKYGVKPKSKSKKSTTEGEGRGGETRGGGREESTRGGGR